MSELNAIISKNLINHKIKLFIENDIVVKTIWFRMKIFERIRHINNDF